MCYHVGQQFTLEDKKVHANSYKHIKGGLCELNLTVEST